MPSLNTGNAILSNAIAVNSSYNVGIGGAASGSFKLQVTGTTNLTGALTGTSATFSGILAETKTADGIIQTIGGNETKANIYQFTSGGLAGAVFNIGHNFYYDGTNYGQGNASKSGWVISSNLNADSFAIGRAAAGSTSAPTTILSFASTGAATFSSSISTGTLSLSGGTIQSSGDYYIGTNNANFIQFYTSNQNRMIITSGGNVGIGTGTPASLLTLYRNANEDNIFSIYQGTVGYATAIKLIGANDDGAKYNYISSNTNGGTIHWQIGGGAVANTMVFYTNNNTERMRISSGGNLYLGVSSSVYSTAAKFEIQYSGAAVYGINMRTTTGDAIHLNFVNQSGSQVGYIYSNNTNTQYTTSSDYRLKQDLKEFNGLSLISNIKTYDYEWKSDKSRMYGVIAHELQELLPQAVSGEKDGERMQGVDYSMIVPVLIKAIQEQQAQIEAQQQQINSLINR
jgi:hypothetical protein